MHLPLSQERGAPCTEERIDSSRGEGHGKGRPLPPPPPLSSCSIARKKFLPPPPPPPPSSLRPRSLPPSSCCSFSSSPSSSSLPSLRGARFLRPLLSVREGEKTSVSPAQGEAAGRIPHPPPVWCVQRLSCQKATGNRERCCGVF